MDAFWFWALGVGGVLIAGIVGVGGVLFLEKRFPPPPLRVPSLPADSGAPASTGETQPAEPQRSGRLDIGDLAHDPGAGNVGDRPWVRARMSYGDMFALGFYGGLGFAVGTALVWIALFTVLLPLMLALAGDTR